MSEKMFERAVRSKLRFAHKGQCTVEDLWDLSVEELDKIYGVLRDEQQTSQTHSLLYKRTQTQEGGFIQLRIDVIKHIVEIKYQESQAAELRAANKARKHRIMELISEKQDEALAGKSVDELLQLVEDLGD